MGKVVPVDSPNNLAAIRDIVGDADLHLLKDALTTLHEAGAIDVEAAARNKGFKIKRFNTKFSIPRFQEKFTNAAATFLLLSLFQEAYIFLIVDGISGLRLVLILACITLAVVLGVMLAIGLMNEKAKGAGKRFTTVLGFFFVVVQLLLLLQVVASDLGRQFAIYESTTGSSSSTSNPASLVPFLSSAKTSLVQQAFPSPLPYRAKAFVGEVRRLVVPEAYFCRSFLNVTAATPHEELPFSFIVPCLSSAFAPDVLAVLSLAYVWAIAKANVTLGLSFLLSAVSFALYLLGAVAFSMQISLAILVIIVVLWAIGVAIATSGFQDFYSLFGEKVGSLEDDYNDSVAEMEKVMKAVHALHIMMAQVNSLATKLSDKAVHDRANLYATAGDEGTPRGSPRKQRFSDNNNNNSSNREEEKGLVESDGMRKTQRSFSSVGKRMLSNAEKRLGAKSNVNSALLALSGLRSTRFFLENVQLYARLQIGPIKAKRSLFSPIKVIEDAMKPFYIDAARKGLEVVLQVDTRPEDKPLLESSLAAVEKHPSSVPTGMDSKDDMEAGKAKEGRKTVEKDRERQQKSQTKFENGRVETEAEYSSKKHPLAALSEEMVVEAAPADTIFVKGDKELFTKAISILMDNAVKYTESGSIRITISIRCLGEGKIKVRATVADDGRGIHEADLERIFSPIALDNSLNAQEMGSIYYENASSKTILRGLSLYIARTIAKTFDGDVTAKSTVGRGSVFVFSQVLSGKILSPADEIAESISLGRRYRAGTRNVDGVDEDLLYPLFRIAQVEVPEKVVVQKELTKRLNTIVSMFNLSAEQLSEKAQATDVFRRCALSPLLSSAMEEQSLGFRFFVVSSNTAFVSAVTSTLWSIPSLRKRARVDVFPTLRQALSALRRLHGSSQRGVEEDENEGEGGFGGVGLTLDDYLKTEKFERRWKWDVAKEKGFLFIDIPASKLHDEVLKQMRQLPQMEEASLIREKFDSAAKRGQSKDGTPSLLQKLSMKRRQKKPDSVEKGELEDDVDKEKERGTVEEGASANESKDEGLVEEAERVLTGGKGPSSWTLLLFCPQTPLHSQKCGQVSSLLSRQRIANRVVYKPVLRAELAKALLSCLEYRDAVGERRAETPPPSKDFTAEDAEVRANEALAEAQLLTGMSTTSPGTKSAAYRDLLLIRERLSPAKKPQFDAEEDGEEGRGSGTRFQSRIGKALGSAASSYWKTLRSTVLSGGIRAQGTEADEQGSK